MSNIDIENKAEPVTIILTESSDAHSVKQENMIFASEFHRATTLINRKIQEASCIENENSSDNKDSPDELKKIRKNDTIAVLGPRGSGKTTFLLSILEYYKEGNKSVEVGMSGEVTLHTFVNGLKLPVIWTCRHGTDAELKEWMHFDTRQYNHILWENEDDLYDKLINRIKGTILIDE